MFTGIIEELGTVKKVEKNKGNIQLTIEAKFTQELRVDQSVAHNGVCLTVISIKDNQYSVIAIKETLEKTNLGNLISGDKINLERCMKIGDRLDGHIVQGHIDLTATCTKIETLDGSWMFKFKYAKKSITETTVEKGSITINGTSLTVVDSSESEFSVCIIPYTFENTSFKYLKEGSQVNIEFDIIGKYIARMMKSHNKN
ncbi:MAG: riboflavin synthase subunit alpha [Cryomorphaceae bacterium]|nr:MAG: riboflavin synthase subunit alpha [Cryomorphaceae bacterium]